MGVLVTLRNKPLLRRFHMILVYRIFSLIYYYSFHFRVCLNKDCNERAHLVVINSVVHMYVCTVFFYQ